MALSDFLIASKTAKARKELGDYSRKAGKALGKQSKWANLGRMIGQTALPALAAASGPIGWLGTAAATGLGSYLGGKWGREAAGKTKGGKTGKLEKGTWAQGSRDILREDIKDMRSMLKEQNMSAALSSAVTAGAKAIGTDKLKAAMQGDVSGIFNEKSMFGMYGKENVVPEAIKEVPGLTSLTPENPSWLIDPKDMQLMSEKVSGVPAGSALNMDPTKAAQGFDVMAGAPNVLSGSIDNLKARTGDLAAAGTSRSTMSKFATDEAIGNTGSLGGFPVGGNIYQPGFNIAQGDSVVRRNKGGKVPSRNPRNMLEQTTDSVPAMLTPGEFVIRKEAVDEIGVDKLEKLNRKGNVGRETLRQLDNAPQTALGVRRPSAYRNMQGYQEGGKVGLGKARDYEYNPNLIGNDYEYGRKQKDKSVTVEGKNISQAEENFNVSTKDRFQTASLVSATDNPKLFGLRKNVSDFGVTHTNEYITGGEAGHLKTIDDGFEMEGVDPHNIATAEYGKKLLGFIPYGYKGEVKANVGKGAKEAFIPKELMENMVKGVSKDDTQHSFVQDLRNKGFAGGGLVRGNMYNAMRRRMR